MRAVIPADGEQYPYAGTGYADLDAVTDRKWLTGIELHASIQFNEMTLLENAVAARTPTDFYAPRPPRPRAG